MQKRKQQRQVDCYIAAGNVETIGHTVSASERRRYMYRCGASVLLDK